MSTPCTKENGLRARIPAPRPRRASIEKKIGPPVAVAVPIQAKRQSSAAGPMLDGIGGEKRDALERVTENLRRANGQLEEFAYVASHDLREPLRMVNIYTQLLIEECGEAASERARQFADHVQYNVARMQELVKDVLHYSQVIHEGHECAGVPVPLHRSLEHALAVFRDRLDAAGAKFAIRDLPVVSADEMGLALVFQNLLSNSLKYAHPDRTLSIRIWAQRHGDLWTTYFADNGIGFEPQFAERIFGLFKRLHGRDVPGTGLGLAICRRIIERYGGTIRAEAEPDAGATFMFSLKGSSHDGSSFADTSRRGQSR